MMACSRPFWHGNVGSEAGVSLVYIGLLSPSDDHPMLKTISHLQSEFPVDPNPGES